MKKPIQDLYPENLAHCYGCGKNNTQGHQLKTYLEGEETISRFTPDLKYTAIPGSVYGGLIASLLDCHGTASAAAFACVAEGISLEQAQIPVRCVTGNLNVNFKAMTPQGKELVIMGKLKHIEGRKITVEMTLSADNVVCATGEILAIKLRE
ncbi:MULTISPECIES: PaaI family thioesterase [Myroides]|uniref:Acyl-coenzyme A thioesterase THEM4 n=1 Tax=Myroides albus TaxID=2562892 RepID=A0A6I3LN45_9FLAO|nr:MULTISPECIES: PaaI family thioesterase [Myroides]MTG99304.1 PaaI family thioesterase [Myroides albus]MVX36733.1 PaaI family thioesterase [Myroides sp. LoEW2-1]UVD79991.1 PaaI family thioesterase [Myroides albus]